MTVTYATGLVVRPVVASSNWQQMLAVIGGLSGAALVGLAIYLFRTANNAGSRTGKVVIFDAPGGAIKIALVKCSVDDVEAAIDTQVGDGWHLDDVVERTGDTVVLRFWRANRSESAGV